MLISKSKVFFKSVERNLEQISKKFWTGFPRALPPGISMKQIEKNCKKRTLSLLYYIEGNFYVSKDNSKILVNFRIVLDYHQILNTKVQPDFVTKAHIFAC